MTRTRPLRRMLLVMALPCAMGGCAKKQSTAPPAESPPPEVVATWPVGRATGIPYDLVVWARFRDALDPATVNDRTVFLKLDTQRIPSQVSLADSGHVIMIRPTVSLAVRRTHTVEITPSVRTVSGSAFAKTWFWQFTTISVRRPVDPEPRDGTPFESPHAPLFWLATEATAGPVEYTVRYGADSAQVAAGGGESVVTGSHYALPPAPWTSGVDWFWRVSARNVETGDADAGPVWRFHVAPADAPIDSVILSPLDCSTYDQARRVWRCDVLISSPSYGGITRFTFPPADSSLVVAYATFALLQITNTQNPPEPQLWELAGSVSYCTANPPGIPATASDGFLAVGAPRDEQGQIVFSSARLSTQVTGRLRGHPEFHDYTLRSSGTLTYNPSAFRSGVRIYYYKPPGTLARRMAGAR